MRFFVGRLTCSFCVSQRQALKLKLGQLQRSAENVTQLLGYVSLNEAAMRKILKKAAKNLQMKSTYGPGLMSMRIEHPHEPGWKLLQVSSHRDVWQPPAVTVKLLACKGTARLDLSVHASKAILAGLAA